MEDAADRIVAAGIERVYVRSALTCLTKRGICAPCYGRDLARNRLVAQGGAGGLMPRPSLRQRGALPRRLRPAGVREGAGEGRRGRGAGSRAGGDASAKGEEGRRASAGSGGSDPGPDRGPRRRPRERGGEREPPH